MSEQFMKPGQDLVRLCIHPAEKVRIRLAQELTVCIFTPRAADIAKINILEANISANLVVVREADTKGQAPAAESQYIQRRELWLEELVLLKIGAPWQSFQKLLCTIDQDAELARDLCIHNGYKTLKLGAHTCRVPVCLDETDSSLDRR
eukprot:CAMPEP_0180694728 /NCGR_PEP_ID=MMETSP1038_2-20121128/2067_1 /TAXON_ID=632150 /ORGANISM="Azadinium spinosum, Strain 3D9" /LENGTH=148 /DNA_ID=CAMNT_0022726093 /DNA_START=234 /DNA_END=680 /DNA_ORIENTATION=-